MQTVQLIITAISLLGMICCLLFFIIRRILKRVRSWIDIFLFVAIIILLIIGLINIITYTIKDRDSETSINGNVSANISPGPIIHKNGITKSPTPGQSGEPSGIPSEIASEEKINYQWYQSGKTYVREDGHISIAFDWHNEDYVRFIFNDGFVMTETQLKVDDKVEDGLLYEVVKAGTIKLIYFYKEDKIEVIDSELNYDAHSGIYYPSNNPESTLNNKINYQWYQSGIKYIGGEDGDVSLEVNRFSDGYFQFAFDGSYVMGTSFLSDTMKSNAIYYNVSDDIQLFYYYNEDKIEVVNTEYEDDYICGYYYPEEGSNQGVSEEQVNNQINYNWYYDETVFVREDGAHTFSMGWLDNDIYQFIFDGGYVAGMTGEADSNTISNALVYKDEQEAGSFEVRYYYNEDKIQVIDNTGDAINYSGFYNAIKPLQPSEYSRSAVPVQGLDISENDIDYEWYFPDKEYVSEDGTNVFCMDYLDSGYLYFIFNGNEASMATHFVDDTTVPNALIYKSDSVSGIMYVIYFYAEDKVQVIDSLGEAANYSGYYYLQ